MMLTTTVVILPLLIAYVNAYKEYPEICQNETFTLSISSDTLSREFITSSSIKCINIKSGGIRYMDHGAFDGVPNLIYLNLERNNIGVSDLFSFGSMANLKALILSNQNANYYDSEVSIHYIYPELQYLNLRNSKISVITNHNENSFPKLKHLDISSNSLRSFQFIQLWMTSLTHLHLDNNGISEFSLNTLTNLETLTLDNNNIEKIGDGYYRSLDLTGLINLKNLSVARNKIYSINRLAFNEIVNLRYLNLSENKLSLEYSNFESFGQLTSLEVLALNDNNFETIPFTVPLNITDLSMNGNKLGELSMNSFFMVPYLRTLSLARNQIWIIDENAFSSLLMLEELYLNDNEIISLPNSWSKSIKNLKYLDLSKNNIASLDYVFDSYVPLNGLRLDCNPLKNIKMDLLTMLGKNLTIYFNFSKNRPNDNCPC